MTARLHKNLVRLKLQLTQRHIRDLTSRQERQDVEGKAEVLRKMQVKPPGPPGFLTPASPRIRRERAFAVRVVCRQPMPIRRSPATRARKYLILATMFSSGQMRKNLRVHSFCLIFPHAQNSCHVCNRVPHVVSQV